MKKSNSKNKKLIIIFSILCFLFFIFLCLSLYNIIRWNFDSKKTNQQLINIQNLINIEEVQTNNNTEIIESPDENSNDYNSNDYIDYTNINLIDVNFNKLKNINNQTKGWLQVNGTNINYPIVQTNNNEYYLTHSFDNSYNSAGWVFLDYRNRLDSTDKNTIIYAHGRLDKTMFGSLNNILGSDWLNNYNNHIVKLSTEYENTLWQVFSVYKIPTTSDYIQVDFNNDKEFENFANMLIDRSIYKFNININESDKILTLSTCYNNYEKVVLHAKLVKREIK